ncbi:MAG: carbohydrate binding family 9 domain-containing protein [bacterium]|nr:carbohydrate binding family 9 domain-containing protein [bacterium]
MRATRLAAAVLTAALPALAPNLTLAAVPSFAPEGPSPAYTETANGTATALPSIEARYLDGAEIELDGRLDEAVWDEAQTGWGFRQVDPDRFTPAAVPSTFKILYDRDAVYLGMACWENDMADVASFLGRRDQIEASDIVSIYFDPYHDRTTGYNFRVSPAGVQADAYIFDNGNRDWNWDAVWQAEVSHDARGWYVEIRIPFSQMRYKPGPDMTWGLQVYRWLHGRGEDTGWVLWDRDQSGFVSRWGELTGLKDVPAPRQLEVLPYVVARSTDPATDGDDSWKHSQNFGADFKYGVTANLTLNATFQPDFGQVEADPAVLNLSPFETWYQEKRPFFIEGARFFQHPHFNMFYSRRIGTGDPNARIRGAAKLTGKLGGDVSLAVLAAATDVAAPGRSHNPLSEGKHKTYYGLIRTGKEFDEGNHRFNIMGTAVHRDEGTFLDTDEDRLRRDGYSGGGDFQLHFRDRMYRLDGSAVGSIIDPHTEGLGPDRSDEMRYGTAGRLSARKLAGVWRGGLRGYWENNKFDPNDMGFLSAPDEKVLSGDVSWIYNADGDDGAFNHADINLDGYKSWFYAGNAGDELGTGETAWSYGSGHRQSSGVHFSAGGQLKSFHNGWIYLGHSFEGSDKYGTRTYDGMRGPLKTTTPRNLVAFGATTDWRKPWSVDFEYAWDTTMAGSLENEVEVGLRWNQSEHFSHWIGFGYSADRTADHWLDNFGNSGSQPGVDGIGGVDYVFAELRRRTWDVTLRSSILFDRDRSLQIYLQPFYTYGSYDDPRWLATADSHDLRPYDMGAEGREATDYDFEFGAVNLNVVYRWEYRPGSTVYLVWTHQKNRYEEGFDHPRGGPGERWEPGFDGGFPFRAEPQNTFLAKVSYWFSI